MIRLWEHKDMEDIVKLLIKEEKIQIGRFREGYFMFLTQNRKLEDYKEYEVIDRYPYLINSTLSEYHIPEHIMLNILRNKKIKNILK